ncbi:predicted protein [Plenodomus lingam JN3]|uniref:Predicted protein n=1 Tax=Leptosphaeria maculans (strain JN3 / isolate v23.1.3 / race Av1-4-5-6-7-8) TaxID=985895 RepID=E4ZWT9_LEPMJ|nr:predicted protein [Plenodomus lingam JN3]CBX96065.1 predicted protein [Plenodomus lingam JN3]
MGGTTDTQDNPPCDCNAFICFADVVGALLAFTTTPNGPGPCDWLTVLESSTSETRRQVWEVLYQLCWRRCGRSGVAIFTDGCLGMGKGVGEKGSSFVSRDMSGGRSSYNHGISAA